MFSRGQQTTYNSYNIRAPLWWFNTFHCCPQMIRKDKLFKVNTPQREVEGDQYQTCELLFPVCSCDAESSTHRAMCLLLLLWLTDIYRLGLPFVSQGLQDHDSNMSHLFVFWQQTLIHFSQWNDFCLEISAATLHQCTGHHSVILI